VFPALAAKPEKSVRACSSVLRLDASGAIPPRTGICYSAKCCVVSLKANSTRAPESVSFRQPERAARDLEQVSSRLSAETLAALLHLLPESPGPDQALSLLERLLNQSSGELIALFDRDHVLLHYAVVIFGHSYWLGEALIQNSDILGSLQRQKDLERSLEREDFLDRLHRFRSHFFGSHCGSHSEDTDVALLLARFKKREYIRIALRDLLGISTLGETTAEISALADVLIAAALEEAEMRLRKRHGVAAASARFAVLALGKLGGNELNYSSDVDLLYLFSGPGPSHGDISQREYAIRLAQTVTDVLSRATPEGAIFRIDLRLRPRGHEGEPAIALRWLATSSAECRRASIRRTSTSAPLRRRSIRVTRLMSAAAALWRCAASPARST
jgi:glutamate-ammonia-ligase adenylyltransferase